PVYREKKAEYDKVDKELNAIRESNTAIIAGNAQRLSLLRQKRDQAVATSKVVSQNSDGLLARLQAMSDLSSESKSVMLASWFILLLFITIESAPIIVKLLSARGPYDDMLEAEEYIKQAEVRKRVVKAEPTEDHQIDLHSLLEKERNDKLYEVEKDHVDNEASMLRQINKLKVQLWKDEELEKLKQEAARIKEAQKASSSDIDETIKIFEPEESPEIKDIPIMNDTDTGKTPENQEITSNKDAIKEAK
ncbi:MAG TPA: DUF4407 domain-containing protein, partial [Bacteroidetes bacterium]|nr:DUF4407 domain-containing protein [Bacteroidota bacterium]